jgi:hypothetical protein
MTVTTTRTTRHRLDEAQAVTRAGPIPFTPLRRPVNQTRFALVTTAGIWNTETEPPFDYEREKREPWWGDPTYRVLRSDIRQEQIGAGHLHLNDDVLADVASPADRRWSQIAAGGRLAGGRHYSFGLQGGGPKGADVEWEGAPVPRWQRGCAGGVGRCSSPHLTGP